MSNFLSDKYLLLLIRICLGFVFVYAAVSKIADAEVFAQSIDNYKLLPLFVINFLAIVLPWIELTAGLFLIFGILVKENAVIINAMLLVFIIAIAISLARGLNIECGCFGTQAGTKIGVTKIVENLGLLIIGVLLIKFDSNFLSVLKSEN